MPKNSNSIASFVLCAVHALACSTSSPENAHTSQALGTGLFPKMPGWAGQVTIYDFRLADAGRIDHLADDVATARALQGLVNRNGARVYVVASDHEAQWIDQITQPHVTISTSTLGGGPVLEQMFSTHQGAMTGRFIVYDTTPLIDDDWSFPLALTQAGIESGLPVTGPIRARLEIIKPAPADNSGFITSRFGNRTQAYEWARQNLLPTSGTAAVFSLRQGTWRAYDYAVATRSFTLHLDWSRPDERTLARQILSDPRFAINAPIPLLGYYFDSRSLNDPNCQICAGDTFSPLAAESGLYGMGADFFGNASFWSQFPRSAPLPQRSSFTVRRAPDRIYTSLFLSDGDNFQHNQNFIRTWLNGSAIGLNPGISINPGLVDLAPPLFSWARSTITPDAELISGPNGLGYSFPSLSSDAFGNTYRRWVSDNEEYMKAAGLVSAQLWREAKANNTVYGGDLPRSDDPVAMDFLRRQPSLAGVLLGDRRLADGGVGAQVHVFGDKVAADAVAVTVDGPSFQTALEELQNKGRTGFWPIQVKQQELPARFSAALASLNQSSTRVVPLSPHDWFDSVRAEHLSMDRPLSTTKSSYVIHSFRTAASGLQLPEESHYLVPGLNNSAIDNDHRYADMKYSWAYDIDVPSSAHRLRVRADVRGDCKITITNTAGVSSVRTFYLGPNRTWIDFDVPPELLPSGKVRFKFEDATPTSGLGPNLWELEMSVSLPDSFEFSTASEWLAYGLGWNLSYQPWMSCGEGFDTDHLYADQSGWVTFSIPVQTSRRNTVEVDVAGQFVLQASASSPGYVACNDTSSNWTPLASAVFSAKETISVDVTDIAKTSNGTIYLRFRDLRPADGQGPSVWRIRRRSFDLLPVAFFDHTAFAFAPGTSSVEEQALLAPAQCNSSFTNGVISGGIIVSDGHRFADGPGMFTYRLQFPATVSTAFVSLEVGGEYVLSLAPETTLEPACPTTFSVVASAPGVAPRHRLSINATNALVQSGSRKAIYLRLTDGTTGNGNGPSLSGLRAFSE